MNCCCCCCTRWVTITLVLTVTTGHTGSSWLFPYHSNLTVHQHLRMIRDLTLHASDFVLVLYHRSHVSMSIVSEFVLSTEQLSTFKLLAGSSSLILYYSTSEFHHARFQNTQVLEICQCQWPLAPSLSESSWSEANQPNVGILCETVTQ
jgi:hypothetical protein